MSFDFNKLLDYYFVSENWTLKSHRVFKFLGLLQIFYSSLILITTLIVLREIRTGPWFVTRIIVAIMVVAASVMILQTGIIFNCFESDITNAIGTFFFCMSTFGDIVIYWVFSI